MELQLYHILTLTAALFSVSHSQPYQCTQIKSIISQCSCQAGITNGNVDNTKVVIDCRNINLSTVPLLTGRSSYEIYEMTLAGNQIATIPENAFDGLRIQRLNLLNNRVNFIDPNAFKGLENDLLELRLGSDIGSNLLFNVSFIVNLTHMSLLHLENFRFPSNHLTPGGLNRLSALKTLELINNSISYFSSLSLPTGLTALTLVGQDLTSLPLDILHDVTGLQQLTITHTNITEIGPYLFTYNTNLQLLDLGNNKINIMRSACFNGSSGAGVTNSLKHLSLRNNPLSLSVMDPIRNLVALTSLDLSYTQLQELPANATFLQNKAALLSLTLEGNNVQSLPPDTFFGLTALEELNLAHNKLAMMNNDVLGGLTKLLYLDLSYQTAGTKLLLPLSTTSLTSLKIFNASATPLDQANAWSMISVLTSLTTLELDSTEMTTISDYALRNLTKLTTLSLNHNQLTTLNQAMMAGPLGLRRFSLVGNRISTLDQCTFHSYTFPLDLFLASNPLRCDCGLYWLVGATKQNDIILSGSEQCSDNSPFVNFNPNPCGGQPNCLELYTTTTTPTVTTTPNPYLQINLQAGITTITVRWAVHNFAVSYYKIRWTNLETSDFSDSDSLGSTSDRYTVQSLKPATGYSICLYATASNGLSTFTCKSVTTNSTAPAPEEGGLTSKEIGIIVGVIVGGVLLLVIIGAIVFIVVVLRRPQKKKDVVTYPVQPHNFTPTELPTMGANSRHFSRPPSKEGSNGAAAGEPTTRNSRSRPKVGRALDENIKVMVISDGHTNPQSPGRVSGGSYQFLNEKYPNPNPGLHDGAVGGAQATGATYYDMDSNSRSLPSVPRGSHHGYQNHGYRKDSESDTPHAYQQIDL